MVRVNECSTAKSNEDVPGHMVKLVLFPTITVHGFSAHQVVPEGHIDVHAADNVHVGEQKVRVKDHVEHACNHAHYTSQINKDAVRAPFVHVVNHGTNHGCKGAATDVPHVCLVSKEGWEQHEQVGPETQGIPHPCKNRAVFWKPSEKMSTCCRFWDTKRRQL